LGIINLAIAPIAIVVVYLYIRDKYEKEPLNLLFLGLLFGGFIVAPIIVVEEYLSSYASLIGNNLSYSLYVAFIVAALTEESFKFLIVYALIFENRNFNEKFDGIVYAAFVSLGFALVENILYVVNPEFGGAYTAMMRSIFAVPAHALFGVTMGYYLALAKFEPERKMEMLLKAFFIPIFLHGLYDFILIYQNPLLLLGFVPYVLFIWVTGFRKMKEHIQASPFKDKEIEKTESQEKIQK